MIKKRKWLWEHTFPDFVYDVEHFMKLRDRFVKVVNLHLHIPWTK